MKKHNQSTKQQVWGGGVENNYSIYPPIPRQWSLSIFEGEDRARGDVLIVPCAINLEQQLITRGTWRGVVCRSLHSRCSSWLALMQCKAHILGLRGKVCNRLFLSPIINRYPDTSRVSQNCVLRCCWLLQSLYWRKGRARGGRSLKKSNLNQTNNTCAGGGG